MGNIFMMTYAHASALLESPLGEYRGWGYSDQQCQQYFDHMAGLYF